MLPEVGAVVGGRYKIERRIGEGGMAIVYEASTPEGQRVALKILKEEAVKSQEVVTRFKREGRAARKLRSPHAVRVYDVGTATEGYPYMAMELLAGRDLSEELLKRGPLPIAEAVGYVIQACVAIREAHHRRIVHRDLKPDNLFLVKEGDDTLIKVLDFGISKLQDELTDMTGTQSVMGTPYYMSPEQIRLTKAADARSDLWSLGVILYELLTGKVPYDGNGNMGFVMVQICINEIPPMREARPEISPELEKAILRALEKDRDKRVQTAEELLLELSRATGLPMPPLETLEPMGSQPEISVSAVTPLMMMPGAAPPRPATAKKITIPLWAWIVGGAGVFFLFLMIGVVVAVVLHDPVKPAPSASATVVVPTPEPPPTVTPLIAVSTSAPTPSVAIVVPSASSSAPHVVPPTVTTNILSKRR